MVLEVVNSMEQMSLVSHYLHFFPSKLKQASRYCKSSSKVAEEALILDEESEQNCLNRMLKIVVIDVN